MVCSLRVQYRASHDCNLFFLHFKFQMNFFPDFLCTCEYFSCSKDHWIGKSLPHCSVWGHQKYNLFVECQVATKFSRLDHEPNCRVRTKVTSLLLLTQIQLSLCDGLSLTFTKTTLHSWGSVKDCNAVVQHR